MKTITLKKSTFFNLNLFLNLSTLCWTQSPQTLANIQISFSNNGTHTAFVLISSQGGNLANTWMAVGLNLAAGAMVKYFKAVF